MSKIIQWGGFPGRLLGPLLKTDFGLVGNVLTLIDKSILVPLGLTEIVLATDEVIHNKVFRSDTTTLVFSNEGFTDIMKIIESLGERRLLTKHDSEIIDNEAKEKKDGIFGMLLGEPAARLLRSSVLGKGIIIAGKGRIRSG